jgi:hypothetical protein
VTNTNFSSIWCDIVICNLVLQLKCVVTYAYVAWPFATQLQLKWVVTYDKELGCIHVEKHCALDLDKDCPLGDVHMAINNNFIYYNNK